MKFLNNTSGFTLVEMVLATTIFAVMSIAVISIYLQTTALSSRLKATRYLSETAREITERIDEDVKERGMSGVSIPSHAYTYWNGGSDYTQSGTEILGVGDGDRVYIYGKKNNADPYLVPCEGSIKTGATQHCGLYVVDGFNTLTPGYKDAFNLVDSFIPDEDKKRVKIENFRFYLSGDGESTEKKVTLVFTLVLMPRIGVPGMDLSDNKLLMQTTISERFFKQNF